MGSVEWSIRVAARVPNYGPRIVDEELVEALHEHPAIILVGPRGAGKTTTGRRHASSIVRLDNPAEPAAFIADADAALAGFDEPVLLDEWPAVPQVLAAVKRAVDDNRHPGRFVLTGSVRADLEAETWPDTGAGELEVGDVDEMLRGLAAAPLERHPVAGQSIGAWSRRDRLRLVDAIYVELAETLKAPLITTDRKLHGEPSVEVVMA